MEKLNSLGKTIAILEYIATVAESPKVKEIAEALDINRTTVYRIIEQLEEESMVKIDENSKKIQIGSKAYFIGNAFIRNDGISDGINQILKEIASKFPMAVGYSIADSSIKQGKVLNLFEVSSLDEIKPSHVKGKYYPVNRGAYGKTLMAFHKPEGEIVEILENANLYSTTEYSKTDINELLNEFEEIRNNNFGYSYEDTLYGFIGIGRPVRNQYGEVVGCIAAACHKFGWNEETKLKIQKLLIEASKRIEKIIE